MLEAPDLPARRVTAYFVLVGLLAAPFWLLGAFVDHDLLPGLPIAASAVVCPALAASILSFREGAWAGLKALLRRAVDLSNVGRWLAPAALINPVLFGLFFASSRLLGEDIPNPMFSAASTAALFALFVPSAVLEELGWSGYALERLQQRIRPLSAALIIGAVWALWHIPALVQVGRTTEWIAWWCVWTVTARIVMVWLYNWAGASVPAVVTYHAISNVCWQLYPISGSYFDPRTAGLITLGLAVVLMLWRGSAISVR